MQKVKVYLQIFTNLILTIALVLLIVFVLPKMIHFFLPFVIGFFISLIANPLVKFMEKKIKIVRKHGSAIINQYADPFDGEHHNYRDKYNKNIINQSHPYPLVFFGCPGTFGSDRHGGRHNLRRVGCGNFHGGLCGYFRAPSQQNPPL